MGNQRVNFVFEKIGDLMFPCVCLCPGCQASWYSLICLRTFSFNLVPWFIV